MPQALLCLLPGRRAQLEPFLDQATEGRQAVLDLGQSSHPNRALLAQGLREVEAGISAAGEGLSGRPGVEWNLGNVEDKDWGRPSSWLEGAQQSES